MYTLMCKDIYTSACTYIAKGHTEDEVISMMMEHTMKTHPERVKELMATMQQDEISEMMREKIRREI